MSSVGVFGVALHATLKTSLVVGAGAALSHYGKWRDSTVSDLSAVTVRLLLPCFLWSSLAGDVRPEELHRAWIVPVFAAAHILIGMVLGLLALAALALWRHRTRRLRGAILTPALPPTPHSFWEGVLSACAFSNASGLPLSLLPTVLQGAPQLWIGARNATPADRLAKTHALSVVLVTLYAVLNKCLMWTAGRALLERGHGWQSAKHRRLTGGATATLPPRLPPSWPTPQAGVDVDVDVVDVDAGVGVGVGVRIGRRLLREPVVVACALGIGTALTPPVRRLFARHGENTAPLLGFVIDAAAFMGRAAFPLMMLLLGATLDTGSRRSRRSSHSSRSHACAPVLDKVGSGNDASEERLCDGAAVGIGIAVRLCAMPIAGHWLVHLAEQSGYLPPLRSSSSSTVDEGMKEDAALVRFVLLLGACMPSAMLLALMAQLHGAAQAAAMSKLLFLQYLLAPISLTFSIAAALRECTVT